MKANFPSVKVVPHQINQRFAVSCNEGVKRAAGRVVIFLNNDVVPEPDFIRPLLANFKEKRVFAVGCCEKSKKGTKLVYSGRSLGVFKRGFLVHRRAEDQSQANTLWAAAGSAAYRKDIWEKLGGMDPIYKPAYMEDIDISYRALKSGYRVLFEPKSVVNHQHETTNIKAFGKEGLKIAGFKNQILFIWKNITDTDLLVNHFVWFFYHLIVTSIKTRGLFLIGFLKAASQIPQAINSRNQAKKLFRYSDKQILKDYA